MNFSVMHAHPAGRLRPLLAALCLLLLAAGSARAASLQWRALPDRERVSIVMTENDSIAGAVGRIAPTGVIVPFAEIPAGVFLDSTPEGAAIFKGTKYMGHALVILTQTPEFGFVVSKQTPKELVVDFFHNPLGARWKATEKAPSTEVAPDFAIPDMAAPDAVSRSLADDPQGKAEAAAPPGQPAPAEPTPEGPAPTEQNPQQPQTQAPPTGAQPAPAAPVPPAPEHASPPGPGSASVHAPAPGSPKPVVVVLPGSPAHATAATQMADPPQQEVPQHSVPPQEQPPSPAGAGPSGEAAPARPFLDANEQTTARTAALPLPEPPISAVSGMGSSSVSGVITLPDQSAPPLPASPPPTAQPSAPAPQPPAAQDAAPQADPAPLSALPPQQTAPAAPPATEAVAPRPAARPEAAPAEPQTPPPGVGVRLGDGAYGGAINTGGLEAIFPAEGGQAAVAEQPRQAGPGPEEGAIAAQAPPHPDAAPPQAADEEAKSEPTPPAHSADAAQADAGVVYVDQDGNPVPPPPEPAQLIPEIKAHINANEFAEALDKANLLLDNSVLDDDQREDLLHIKAEMLFAVHKEQLTGHYTDIADATNQAINFNQKSRRNAAALLRLGFMNLKLNNIPEAEARFNMLRRLFPDDEHVALTYYYWGDYHFSRNEFHKAADEFQYVLQEYPNSRYAREAALGLARSFYRLGYYEQSFNVVDYIERRWERFYVQYPPFLNMMGDVAFRLNKLDHALRHYRLYTNLEPMGEEADIILTRMGDIYGMQREKAAAREMYTESMKRFPDKDGGLVAMMRLAEEGVNDNPTIAGMFAVFDGPFSLAPMEVYRTIIRDHPKSALVPLAEIKLALWHLWKKNYIEALDILSAFQSKYPKHELLPKAKEIAMQAYAVLTTEARQDERYTRMRKIWEQYPIVRDQGEIISPESRLTLAMSYRHDNMPNEALQTIEPFFLGNKVPEYSEAALSLVLAIYLEHEQWQSIREVAKRVDLWELTEERRMQLDYSLALAAENLGESDKAAAIWQRLHESGKLPPSQMAYAAFFLARDAERQRELEKAFFLGQQALGLLTAQVERSPNAADVGKIQTQLGSLMDVAETAGRLREALGFAEQYLQYLPEQDPERMAVRYRMARIYKKQGDADTWKNILNELAAQAPESVYGRLASSELSAAAIAEDAARFSPTGQL